MVVLLEARGRAVSAQATSQSRAAAVPHDDAQSTLMEALAPARSVAEVSLADIRHPLKLAKLDNDAIVTFSFGSAHSIDAYGATFEGCRTASRGNIPGTDKKLPPVHFLSQPEFSALVAHAEAHFAVQESGGTGGTTTRAWFDPQAKLIEVGVITSNRQALPERLEMTALEAKWTLALIVHESIHGAGGGEFDAFRAEYDFLHRVGAIAQPKTHLEIMLDISDLYSDNPSAVANAQDEFHRACVRDGCVEQEHTYWQREEERGELEGDCLSDLDFPEDW